MEDKEGKIVKIKEWNLITTSKTLTK